MCRHNTLVVICVVLLLFVLFYVLFVCKCVLPPGANPTAVNKYINTSNNHRDDYKTTQEKNNKKTHLTSVLITNHLIVLFQSI